ncbi:Heterodisulfide reductase, subunit D, putative [Acidilobus saccharovorans 345-15]|uniref:Heterodisulfide reductase, subunit D, putative n=1 Tax=Acidilobus saccharovorans (strain DSM 16705 / JCM 18335 / VKM B-2471 / 345-15) TaxID=666510 RepID=D9Q0K4_ACIS3|nr:(Fe-S)-binding protein [Acidilobus saccharovorans]ADL18842.1 Heterodisulfide reductase, subunit D, putative [Acidilobus saccharovorans 345-15]
MRGLKISSVLRFMRTYTLLTGYPVPAPPGFASQWSRGLDLKRRGSRYLLFTGALYQLVPYINATVRFLSLMESRGLSDLLDVAESLAKLRPSYLQGLVRPDPREVEEYNGILRSIASLLASSQVDFMYDPAVSNMYSGALLFDYGIADGLREHATKVAKAIESEGEVEGVITIDPHTTLTLMHYRELVGFDIKVVNYLELVKPRLSTQIKATIHDSCIYARDLGLADRVRSLLKGAGVSLVEPRNHGTRTSCCGGPVESLSPGLAEAIAVRRVRELREASDMAIAMCPICLSNLRRAGGSVVDIALVLNGLVKQ